MANIGLDATPLSVHGKGLSRVLHLMIVELAHHATPYHFTIFVNSLAKIPTLPAASHITYQLVPVRSAFIWELIQFPLLLRKRKLDLLHTYSDRVPQFYPGRILLYLFELPSIRFDLNHEIMSPYARASKMVTELMFPLSLKRATRVLTSSRATMEELMNSFDLSDTKVHVVYPGRDVRFTPPPPSYDKNVMRAKLSTPGGYILHFSSVADRRDNTPAALRAFHAALPRLPQGVKLVISGRADPAKQDLMQLIKELNLENRISWAGYIPDEDLVDVYRSADAYLDPSLYEGFGLQVLEAMSCGVPVVCSAVTSLPEVVGDAAVLAAPDDYRALAEGLVRILSSLPFANELRRKGLKRAQFFSWPKAIEELYAVYADLLHS